MNWYLNFSPDLSQVPNGATKVPFIQVPTDASVWDSGQAAAIESLTDEQIAALGFLTRAELSDMAQASPGSYWYVFGEANRYFAMSGVVPYTDMTGDRFAPVLHYFVTQLKNADPTAKIVGTSVLNWDYTCIGCGGNFACEDVGLPGYQCGKVWLNALISEYNSRYGEYPPVDVWAIDAYPLDWFRTPNSDLHAVIVIDQLKAMRQYLDTVQDDAGDAVYVDTPIWITEVAVHVGYDRLKTVHNTSGQVCAWAQVLDGQCTLGPYHFDKMSDYLTTLLDWLEANAAAYKIDKWFFYRTWEDIVNVGGGGYMGITFFEGPEPDASLNCLGDTYRARALQYLSGPPQKVKCNAAGDTVAE